MADIISPSIVSILSEIDMERSLWDLVNTNDIDRAYLDELDDSLKKLKTASHNIHSRGGATRGNASDLLAYMASADASISMLDNALDQRSTASNAGQAVVQKAKNFVSNKLMPWLSSMWKGIWALIQKMTNLKEWKISGELGGGAFGLAKSTIEISFG